MQKKLILVCGLLIGLCGCGEPVEERILQPAAGVPASEKKVESSEESMRRPAKEVPENIKQEIMEYSQISISPHEAMSDGDSETDVGILPQADESKDAGQEGNFTEISTIYCTVDSKDSCVRLKNMYDDMAVFTIYDSDGTQISETEEVDAGDELDWTVPADIVSGTYVCSQASGTDCRYVIIELKVREE